MDLLVLVPCRNEERVIARKLANLFRARWPAGSHRILVIDDRSDDRTAELAERACAEHSVPRVRASVVPNDLRPGKSGAIARGLAERSGEELVVLTDADVVNEPDALLHLARAFERDPDLGMACGAQRFVEELPGDGTCSFPDRTLRPAGGLYDRWTAAVRALESQSGRLFSVHGQLLAWRASLGLVPTPGMAADDLDLMLQARAQGVRIAGVREARFLETKPPEGGEREAQALRRARAYVQFLSHARIGELTSRGDVLDRLQGLGYRWIPTAAPWLVPLGLLALTVAALALWPAGVLILGVEILLGASPAGRRLAVLLSVIAAARYAESAGGMTDRWETARR